MVWGCGRQFRCGGLLSIIGYPLWLKMGIERNIGGIFSASYALVCFFSFLVYSD